MDADVDELLKFRARAHARFHTWRASAGMDNAIADHLQSLCAQAGLVDIVVTPQYELTNRTHSDFAIRLGLWAEVAAARGPQMVSDGMITESERMAAETDYQAWLQSDAVSQQLYLLAVEGTRSD